VRNFLWCAKGGGDLRFKLSTENVIKIIVFDLNEHLLCILFNYEIYFIPLMLKTIQYIISHSVHHSCPLRIN
jgi:hypothetical protein